MNTKLNLVSHDFDRAAKIYDQHSSLQQEVALKLLKFSAPYIGTNKKQKILDVGCGTGFIARTLLGQGSYDITQLDISPGMCAIAGQYAPVVNADMDDLPLDNQSQIDVVISSLALQWSNDIDKTLASFGRALNTNKDSYLIFSTFVDGTLCELSQVISKVTNSPHSRKFYTIEEIQQALSNNGFNVLDFKFVTKNIEYDNVLSLMKSIKNIGAANKNDDRKNALTRKNIDDIQNIYQPQSNQKVTASWEIAYFVAAL